MRLVTGVRVRQKKALAEISTSHIPEVNEISRVSIAQCRCGEQAGSPVRPMQSRYKHRPVRLRYNAPTAFAFFCGSAVCSVVLFPAQRHSPLLQTPGVQFQRVAFIWPSALPSWLADAASSGFNGGVPRPKLIATTTPNALSDRPGRNMYTKRRSSSMPVIDLLCAGPGKAGLRIWWSLLEQAHCDDGGGHI